MKRDFKIQLTVWRIIFAYYMIASLVNGEKAFHPEEKQTLPVMLYYLCTSIGKGSIFCFRDSEPWFNLTLPLIVIYCALIPLFGNFSTKRFIIGTWKSLDRMFYVTIIICLIDLLVCLFFFTGYPYQAFSILMDYTIIVMCIWTLRTRKEHVWKKLEEQQAKQIEKQSCQAQA